MTGYQIVTLKETHEQMLCSQMEYPYQMAGTLYLKLIEYRVDIDPHGEPVYEPIGFITVQPQDILKREEMYSQELENELVEHAQQAETQMQDYQKAVEEEMARRAAESLPEIEGGDADGLFG